MSLEAINAERRARMALERRMGELESRVRGMWVFPGGSSIPTYKNLYVGGSNTLQTINSITYYGLNKAGSFTLANIPSDIPTGINQVVANGLCAAYDLGVNGDYTGAGTPKLVWISSYRFLTIQDPANPASTITANGTEFNIRSGCIVFSATPYRVPISGSPGTFGNVYVPNSVAF